MRRTMRVAGFLALRAIGALVLAGGGMLACSGDDGGPRVPADIVLVPNAPVVPQGQSLRLKAAVVDINGREISGKQVTFSSSDEAVLTVDADGTMHSVGPIAPVEVSADLDGLTRSVSVEISQRIVALASIPESLVINQGLEGWLQVAFKDFTGNYVQVNGPITFTSNNTSLVAVAGNGLVTSLGPLGKTTITVQTDTFQIGVPVRVGQIPSTLVLDPVNVVMQPGESRQLSAVVNDLAGHPIVAPPITYTSNAPNLFSVSTSGVVTSLGGSGNGTLTVRVEALQKELGVFIGGSRPVALTHTYQAGTPAYEADLGPGGELVVSEPSAARAIRGTLPGSTLPTTFATGGTPLGVAINHAGTRAYVASGNGLTVVDLGNNQVLSPIPVPGGGTKVAVVVSGDDQRAYVGTEVYVYTVDLSSSQVIDSVLTNAAFFLVLHPTQPRLYVSTGNAREIDLSTGTFVRAFTGTSDTKDLAISPDGTELYVADDGGGFLRVISLASGQVTQSIQIQNGAFGLAASAHLLVVTSNTAAHIYDRATRTLITEIPLGGLPRRPAISADESTIVVPNEAGWVDYIQ